MAIVKTASTLALSQALAEEIMGAFNSGIDVALKARTLDSEMSVGPGSGANPIPGAQGAFDWSTEVSASSGSHTEKYAGYKLGGMHYMARDGVVRAAFEGTNLDGANAAAPAHATRFVYTADMSYRIDDPAYLNVQGSVQRFAAELDYDLADDANLVVRNFTSQVSRKLSEIGYAQPENGTGGNTWSFRSTANESFVGSARYDMTVNSDQLRSATLYSYQRSLVESSNKEGVWGQLGEKRATSESFAIRGDGALDYARDGAGNPLMLGRIGEIKYLASSKSQFSDGSVQTLLDSYRYTNTASAADDIDLQVIADYLKAPSDEAQWARLQAAFFAGDDSIVVSDQLNGGVIAAGDGRDKVVGSKASDDIDGGAGDDLLIGGNGSDSLKGGDGADVLKGGAGDDGLAGGTGDDLLDAGAGNDYLDGGEGNDRLLAGAGNDRLYGGAGDDYLDGGSGNDYLWAGGGHDQLKGGAGNDVLFGAQGNDIIDGGAGNDYISGGEGRDLMTGGTGRDGFVFNAGESGTPGLALESLDQILDFNVAQDMLLLGFQFSANDLHILTHADAPALGTVNSYAALLAAAEANGSYIVVGYDAGNTYVFADMDKNGTLDTAIQLVGIKGEAVAAALVFEQA